MPCYVQPSNKQRNRTIDKKEHTHIRLSFGKSCQQTAPLVSWDCSLYGKAPQNKQHQDQTKLRLHSFLYYDRKNRHMSHVVQKAVAYPGFNTMKF